MKPIQLAELVEAFGSCVVGAPGGWGHSQLLQCVKLCCQSPICCTGMMIWVGSSAAFGAARWKACMEKRERWSAMQLSTPGTVAVLGGGAKGA